MKSAKCFKVAHQLEKRSGPATKASNFPNFDIVEVKQNLCEIDRIRCPKDSF